MHICAGQAKSNHLSTSGTCSPYGYNRVIVVLECGETQVVNTVEVKIHPSGHIVLGAEEAQATEERYTALEAKLQAIRQQNEELTRALHE